MANPSFNTFTFFVVGMLVISNIVSAVETDPGHGASEIGGTDASNRTFTNAEYMFQNNLGVGIDPVTALHVDGTVRMSTSGATKLDIGDGGGYNVIYSYSGIDLNLGGTGNVGINSDFPDGKLLINGSASSSPASNPSLKITATGAAADMTMGLRYSSGANSWIQSGGNLSLQPDGGNLGVYTTSPQTTLHVKSNAGMVNIEGSDHAYIQWYPDSYASGRKAYLGFAGAVDNNFSIINEISGGDIELITSAGRVGIDTSSPSAPLDVAGGTSTTGTIAGDYGIMFSSYDEWLRLNDDNGGGDSHTSGIYFDGSKVGMQGGLCVGCSTTTGGGVVNISGGDLTVQKESSWSTLLFPGTVSDRGFIAHNETSNVAEMRFTAGDDASAEFFSWGSETGTSGGPGSGTWTEWARLTAPGNLQIDGTLTPGSMSCTNCIGAAEIGDGLGLSDVNEAVFQRRVTGTCSAGTTIKTITSTGSVTCETDTVGPGVAFAARNSGSDTSRPEITWNKVEFDVEIFDYGSDYDTVNDRFIAPANGVYHFSAGVNPQLVSAGSLVILAFYVNGALWHIARRETTESVYSNYHKYSGSVDIKLTSGQYVEVVFYVNELVASTHTILGGGTQYTWFTGYQVY